MNILIGIDFSDCSRAALRQAGRLAQRMDARLHALHVIDQAVFDDLARALPVHPDQLRQEMHEQALARLGRFLGEALADFPCESEVRLGDPLDEIVETVRELPAGLLVLGAYGLTGDQASTGSVAFRCVRKAPTRVLLIKEQQGEAFRKVLACVDFSDLSGGVVEQAVRVALKEKAELHLLHIYYGPWNQMHYLTPTTEVNPEYREQYMGTLRNLLEDAISPYRAQVQPLVVHRVLSEFRNRAQGILKYIQDNGIGLAVLGTGLHGALHHLFSGSTTQRVLDAAPCALLVVKPADQMVEAEPEAYAASQAES